MTIRVSPRHLTCRIEKMSCRSLQFAGMLGRAKKMTSLQELQQLRWDNFYFHTELPFLCKAANLYENEMAIDVRDEVAEDGESEENLDDTVEVHLVEKLVESC